MTIYLTGDVHGSATNLGIRIRQIENPSEDDYIIICGDAGLEYGHHFSTHCKKVMRNQFPGTWIVMRGNHDTRYWRDHWKDAEHWSITEDGQFLYQKKYPNIWYVRDGGQMATIDGVNFLFIPGGYSVDKEWRLMRGMPWEEEELLTNEELANLSLLAENYDVDYIIAHTYPFSIEPFLHYLFMDGIKQEEVDKSMEHAIDNILSKNDGWKHYFFGHMHDAKGDIKGKYSMLYQNVISLDDYKD